MSQASATDMTVLRERWYRAEEDGGLPISLKRAYLREALHAVIVHAAGGGRKRAFNPDLLEPIWRERPLVRHASASRRMQLLHVICVVGRVSSRAVKRDARAP
jgi:hypothetical protein